MDTYFHLLIDVKPDLCEKHGLHPLKCPLYTICPSFYKDVSQLGLKRVFDSYE